MGFFPPTLKTPNFLVGFQRYVANPTKISRRVGYHWSEKYPNFDGRSQTPHRKSISQS